MTARSLSERRGVLAAISIATVLLLWWLITALQWVPPLFLPSPAQVGRKFLEVAGQGFMDATLWQHLAASLQRIFLSLFAAILIGVPLGMAMGLNAWVRGLIDPLVELYRPIPPLAYLPLLVIWFGIGETTKVLLIFLAILAPIIIATTHGMTVANGNRIRAVRSLGATRAQITQYFNGCAHRFGRRLVDFGGSRIGGRQAWLGLYGAISGAVFGHRCGVARHHCHRRHRRID